MNTSASLFPAARIWLLTSLFYSFQFFLRSAPNAMAPVLMQDFHIDATMLGVFSSIYYIPYALLQIPLGIALDVWGPKKIVQIGTSLCVLGALIFGCAHTYTLALIGRFLMGAGASVSFIGSVRMNSLWFSKVYLAFAIGLLSALGKLGGALANVLLPLFMDYGYPWYSVVRYLCLGGFMLTLSLWVWAKNGPRDVFVPLVPSIRWHTLYPPFMKVVKSPMVWAMGFYGYSLYLTLTVFSDTYSINFLAQHLHISQTQAGFLAGCVGLGSALGSSLMTYVSDHMKRRLIFVRLCAIGTFLLSVIVFFGPAYSVFLTGSSLFLLGFFSGGQVLSFVVATESLPAELTGITAGFINTFLMVGGALHNPLMGFLIQWRWKGAYIKGMPLYTLENYRIALSSLSLCFFIAVVISFLIRESHPHRSPSAWQSL